MELEVMEGYPMLYMSRPEAADLVAKLVAILAYEGSASFPIAIQVRVDESVDSFRQMRFDVDGR